MNNPDDGQLPPVAIFDRDDTLLVDRHYMCDPADIEWVSGAIEAISLLNKKGYKVCVATNQSGIARGYFTEKQMYAFHEAMRSQLAAEGAVIDGFFHCPHHPGGTVAEFTRTCDCRKPLPGLIGQIDRAFPMDRQRSFLVGDKPRDIQAAEAFGIPGHLFEGGSLLDRVLEILDTLQNVNSVGLP
ncbi:D-glycero-alpha-D-manno-heptose-1,7-bisphosphate 7-phosphatase [Roseibium marinum]|uniref:D,D-heptose 1,7-bisphosphate phosphatase n=1 Tax=Roseibium marinum TaxID=281252 RepID=A0A2S3V2Z6_9HYPH|nr:HAD family hydrolase [Roseibium marinum]POF34357.1 D-glycero-D-manno-heptose 1,7-bisphosphate phosphatase [Roseibium marinum]